MTRTSPDKAGTESRQAAGMAADQTAISAHFKLVFLSVLCAACFCLLLVVALAFAPDTEGVKGARSLASYGFMTFLGIEAGLFGGKVIH